MCLSKVVTLRSVVEGHVSKTSCFTIDIMRKSVFRLICLTKVITLRSVFEGHVSKTPCFSMENDIFDLEEPWGKDPKVPQGPRFARDSPAVVLVSS